MPCPDSTLEFQNYLHNLEFMDLHHDDPIFTWTNKRSSGFVAKKLDRFLVNTRWLQAFPDLSAEFCPPDFSGYCAGWLKNSNRTVQRISSFKFSNYLTRHKDFLRVVHSTWSSMQPHGTYMYKLCKKLKALKS